MRLEWYSTFWGIILLPSETSQKYAEAVGHVYFYRISEQNSYSSFKKWWSRQVEKYPELFGYEGFLKNFNYMGMGHQSSWSLLDEGSTFISVERRKSKLYVTSVFTEVRELLEYLDKEHQKATPGLNGLRINENILGLPWAGEESPIVGQQVTSNLKGFKSLKEVPFQATLALV